MAVHTSVQGRTTFYVSVTEASEGGYLLTVATRQGDAKQFHLATRADVTSTVDLYMAQWEAIPVRPTHCPKCRRCNNAGPPCADMWHAGREH